MHAVKQAHPLTLNACDESQRQNCVLHITRVDEIDCIDAVDTV